MAITELYPNQVRALYEASARTRESARDRAILCLCVDAGLRRREFPNLRCRDVDLVRGVVTVRGSTSPRRIRLGSTSLEVLAPFCRDRRLGDPLLTSRTGASVTERSVHEQLRRLGELAGMGEWVTNRHTRHTFVAGVAARHPAQVVLRLAGHAGDRVRPASAGVALSAQFEPGWTSPLDALLGAAGRRRAA